jgi:hypothetical protein
MYDSDPRSLKKKKMQHLNSESKFCFEKASLEVVQRQQRIWENPVRENTTHYTVGYACNGVLSSYLALGCERTYCVILPAEGWLYLYVWTVCPCIYAYVI